MLRILIPTDFSLLARKAAVYAHGLSQHLDAEFVLLHCDDKPRPAYAMVRKLDDVLRKEALESLQEVADSVKKETGLTAPITVDFVLGDPIASLEIYCEEHKVDLVVMGTKGETVIQNRLFGSVASGVMENVSIPILFVPAAAEPVTPRHIVFATDLTDLDRELPEVIAFARFFGATVNVVHIYPDIMKPETFDEERTQLDLIARTDYPNITFSAVMDSDIIQGINRYINAENCDLLTMFTYKTGILEYLFNESIAEELAAHATRPLLVLRKK
ncbi:MAG: universal stress protein [Flavobacteriales bacterium]|nr:universal stress protein [Flavobacteriales bacterium]